MKNKFFSLIILLISLNAAPIMAGDGEDLSQHDIFSIPEIAGQIVSYLPMESFASFAITCRFAAHICRNKAVIPADLPQKITITPDNETSIQQLKKIIDTGRKISLRVHFKKFTDSAHHIALLNDILTHHHENASLPIISLYFEDSRIGSAGAAAIAANPYLTHVEVLVFYFNNIGIDGAREIARSPNFPNLESLDFFGNNIFNEGAQALIKSQTLTKLQDLNLGCNQIGMAGGQLIMASLNFPYLKTLVLSGNDIGADDQKFLLSMNKKHDLNIMFYAF